VVPGAIEVENTGRELSEESVALLAEPFFRGAATRTTGDGVGLGLAIVDSIAIAHGGRLVLRPRPGGGLIARLELPAS
jgi:signal transduction histidine kinase